MLCLGFCSGGGGLPIQGDCRDSDSSCTTFFPPIVPILAPLPPTPVSWRVRVVGGGEGGIQGEISTGLEEHFKGLPCLQEGELESVDKDKSLEDGKDKGGIGDLACL